MHIINRCIHRSKRNGLHCHGVIRKIGELYVLGNDHSCLPEFLRKNNEEAKIKMTEKCLESREFLIDIFNDIVRE